jgi:hypothetical protein
MLLYPLIGAAALVIILMLIVQQRKSSKVKSSPVRRQGQVRTGGGTLQSLKRNWITVDSGDNKGKAFHVGSRTVTIGRVPSNFIQVSGEKVSRVHCQMSPVPEGLLLTDMKSSNGTFVNGSKVTTNLLSHGDSIDVGGNLFRYHAFGDFNEDASLERKFAGRTAETHTQIVSVADYDKIVKQALANAGGDVKAAAAALGVTPGVFMNMLKDVRDSRS